MRVCVCGGIGVSNNKFLSGGMDIFWDNTSKNKHKRPVEWLCFRIVFMVHGGTLKFKSV